MLTDRPQHTPTARTQAPANAADRLIAWLSRNPKAVSMGLVALVLVTALTWGGIALGRARARQAGFALTQAFAIKDALSHDLLAERAAARAAAKASASPRDDGDDDDARDDGDDDDDVTDEAQDEAVPQFADKAARDAAALDAFAKLAEAHPGTLGTLAALEAAALQAEHTAPAAPHAPGAEPERVAQLLSAAAAPLPSSNALLALAALREAQLAEDAGDAPRALAACERAISAQQQFLGDEVRLVKARLLMQAHDLDGAHAALEDLQNNYPQTALADELRIQMAALEALKARADAPHTAAAG